MLLAHLFLSLSLVMFTECFEMNSIMQVLSIIIIIYQPSWPAVFAFVLVWSYVAVEFDWGKLQAGNKVLHTSHFLSMTVCYRAEMLLLRVFL